MKRRYAAEWLGGLDDRKRPGRPRTTDDVAITLATLEKPPERLSVTHSSSLELGVSNVKVADMWRKHGLQPRKLETFKFSTDQQPEAKLRDVVGLYLNPPGNAIVLRVDEKSQIQALDRTAPILPICPALPKKATHSYIWHGTTTLSAALEGATKITADACYPRHREFIDYRLLPPRAPG